MPYWMGIDIGGTLVKAAVFDSRGRALSVRRASTALHTPIPRHTERDMEELYQQVCAVTRAAVEDAAIPPEEIGGVACAGHGKGLYLWGSGGPLRNGIISTDSRAADLVLGWRADGTEAAARKRSCQSILVSQPCALLRWLKDNEPDIYGAIQWVFEAKDYIRFRLTGEAFAERTDYSGTGLLNLNTGAVDPELLALFGIPEMADKIPPLRDSFDLCGAVTAEAAAASGLAAGTPVAAGMFDIDACALAMGILSGEDLCVIAGTWGINEFIAEGPVLDGSVAMNSLYCLPDRYLIEESSPTSAGNLEWLCNRVFDLEKAAARQAGESVYQAFDRLVEAVPPEESTVLYLPYIFGGSTNPAARGAFLGLDGGDGKDRMIRAVFEGVVFCHLEHIRRLLNARAQSPPRRVRLGGGAAKSRVWVQMYADTLNLPVEVMEGDELGALGAALCAAVACGHFPSVEAAAAAMVRSSGIVEPDPARVEIYRGKYSRYRRFADALDPVWTQ